MAKVLTIREPHASLLLTPFKQIETRSWSTKYRGELYLHASKIVPKYATDVDMWERCLALYRMYEAMTGHPLYLHAGFIFAKAVLTDCVKMTEQNIRELAERNPFEIDAGFYSPGRYMWILKDIQPISELELVRVRGHLGLWNWEGETA